MAATVKISSKNQITIPKQMMESLGVQSSERLLLSAEKGQLILRPTHRSLAKARAHFPRRGQKAASIKQMQEAITQGGK